MKIFSDIKRAVHNQDYRNTYLPFMWHGFFLELTMTMIAINTVLPSLISKLTDNTVVFGALYSIMLGAPFVFNLVFSKFMEKFEQKKMFLLFGIYMRSLSFFGMSAFTMIFAEKRPAVVLISFYFFIFLFSINGGFAGIAYSDIVGKLIPPEKRGGFYASKEFFGGIAALIGGLFVAWIFKPDNLHFPVNYAVGFLVGGIGLILGAAGFWRLREPYTKYEMKITDSKNPVIKSISKVLKEDKTFLRFIFTENITSFSLMVLPFYMVFIKNSFTDYINYMGMFVISGVLGSISSNFLWAYISKRYGSRGIIRLCIFVGGILPILTLVLKPMGVKWYLILFFLVGFITSGRNVGFESYILDIAPEEKRVLYLGIRGTLNILVVLLPLAGGLFINFLGYTITFVLVSLFMLLAFYSIK